MSSTDPVVDVRGLVKTFGSTRALDGLDLTVVPGEVHGFLGPERRREVHHAADPARDDPQGRRRRASARRRPVGPGRRRSTAVSPTCPATSACGPTCRGGEVIDMLLRMRGAPVDRPAPGRDARALRARPDQEGSRVLQGQPAEGRPGRRVRGADGPAGARRADLGAGPADGGGLRRLCRRGPRGGYDGAAVQPHPQRGRPAGRPGHDHPRRPRRGVRAASTRCDTCTGRGCGPTWSAPYRTCPAYPACTT